jgi:hypothetical protein
MGRGLHFQVSLLRFDFCCRAKSSNEDALARGGGGGGGSTSSIAFFVELMWWAGNRGGVEDVSLLLSDALHLDRLQLFEPLFGGEEDTNRGESLPLLSWVLLFSPKELSNAISSCEADGIWALSTTISMGSFSNRWRNEYICCVIVDGFVWIYASLFAFEKL